VWFRKKVNVLESDRTSRSRLIQTFKFLKELNELRNPVQRDLSGHDVLRLDEWPLHPGVFVQRGDASPDQEEDVDAESGVEAAPVIRIVRAALTDCPRPPELIRDWLQPGWEQVSSVPAAVGPRDLEGEPGQPADVAFKDSAERVRAFDAWIIARSQWVDAERPALAARALFERIHELWTKIQRDEDSLELVLADGMLQVAEHQINYPVLAQRVSLTFDPSGPAFVFRTGTESAALHRSVLRLVPSVQARVIAHFENEVEQESITVLGGERTTAFFRRLVQGLFTNGEYVDGRARAPERHCPVLSRQPMLLVRARTGGLSSTLEHIVEDLGRDGVRPAEGLARIVGVESAGVESTGAEPLSSVTHGEEAALALNGASPSKLEILFCKPTNDEQHQIAARLGRDKAVLVQGPPGTGKTHTIANLLGCLLAQGKTVLVTAHTTKALRVLREKVDRSLQPLCLSVLDGGPESQAQLSHAAQAIAARLATSDAVALRREAALLRDRRRELIILAEARRRELREARLSEIEEIVLDGVSLRPIDAAKRVRDHAAVDGWIPGPIRAGVACPLTNEEVLELYAAQRSITPEDEAQLEVMQPDLSLLVNPDDFRLRAGEEARAGLRARSHRPELWSWSPSDGYDAKALRELLERLQQAVSTLSEETRWLREVLFAGWTGGQLKEVWHDLLGAIDQLTEEAASGQRLIAEFGPELPADPPPEALAGTLSEIVAFLEGGGALGFQTKVTHRTWHRVLDGCRIDGRKPQVLEEYRALLAVARLRLNRIRFVSRWRRLVEELGGPAGDSLGALPERSAGAYALEIRKRLEWRDRVWTPLLGALCAAGFAWEVWLDEHPAVPGDHGELARVQRACSTSLTEIVHAQAALLRSAELSAALEGQRALLLTFPQSDAATLLLAAQANWDTESYEDACDELARLNGLRDRHGRRRELSSRLTPCAAEWARQIEWRLAPHDEGHPPGDPGAAWHWRQLQQELERRAAVVMSEIQERLERIEIELMKLAAQIVECETWAAQCERTGLRSRQSLHGYVLTLRKLGKGTGKRAPELIRQAKQLLSSARSAVPVWIMPLSRVYENFDPRETKFDVVIIDEASQSDVTALAALYLGREHVVVGDKEQVTPDAVGQRFEDVERLIATDLQGVPNSHLYDGQTSIYDLAETAFGGVVALREHFRCVPEIIQFSNHLSYGNSIRPLREPLSASVRPAVVSQRVRGQRALGAKINEVEAQEIASLIVACLGDDAYALNERQEPTTFGAISLLGDEQALRIEKLLRERLTPDIFIKHRLLCGNAAQFQGDERDVIFLSMVDQPAEDGPLSYRDAGPKDLYKKRFNVAVSRARNQLWVVHSLDPSVHLKPGDLRRQLIEHARDPGALLRVAGEEDQRVDSTFEKLVLDRLIAAGYGVQTQVSIGSFRIDLVVGEPNRKRLAIECDGEQWHTPEQLQKDLERQAILERQGWIFVRIRGSVFFRDPQSAMLPVFAKLEDLGIERDGSGAKTDGNWNGSGGAGAVVERVRRSARAIRQTWFQQERRSA
jgi:very-short-patch-repair endonuclease